jgi:uncharacterized phage protein gp47/JayE
MATEYGVTLNGFVIKTLAEIRAEIDEDLKTTFGDQINTNPESGYGQLRDIFATREHEFWELFQQLYNSAYPSTADGVSFENILDFSGLELLEATSSTIEAQALFGSASTVIDAGTRISVTNDPTTIFETDEEVTLGSGIDEIQSISFSPTPTGGTFTLKYGTEETASLNYDISNTDLQTALNDLSSLSGVVVTGSVASGFSVTFSDNDGKQPQTLLTVGTNSLTPATTITIIRTTDGVFQGTVAMTCIVNGPKNANAKTLTVIDTPISGFTKTFNVDDATLGRNEETIPEARLRRIERLVTSLAGPIEAIKNKVLRLNDDEYADLPQLESVIVYENVTDITDAKGIQPHRIMVVVRQVGDVTTRDTEIAQAIFDSKAAGIGTSFGNAYSAKVTIEAADLETTVKINGTDVTANAGSGSKTKAAIAAELHTNINAAAINVTSYYTASNEYLEIRSDVDLLFTIENVANCIVSDKNTIAIEITDSMAINHIIHCARPTGINIYLILDNFTHTSEYPVDGDDQLKTILANWGNTLGTGKDIIVYPQLVAQINEIPGITDFDLKIGTSPSPTTDDNIDISDGTSTPPEYSIWSTTNIDINHV